MDSSGVSRVIWRLVLDDSHREMEHWYCGGVYPIRQKTGCHTSQLRYIRQIAAAELQSCSRYSSSV